MNVHLQNIYERVMGGERITRSEMAWSEGISLQYFDRLVSDVKNDPEYDWTFGDLPYNGRGVVTIHNKDELSGIQESDRDVTFEETKKRRHRNINREVRDLDFRLERMSPDHPERAYWDEQKSFYVVMQRLNEHLAPRRNS